MTVPKYVEIYRALRQRCQQEAIGTRLSSERALAQEFGVSPMTVRQALSRLAEDGWITRSVGSGTYVARPTVAIGPTLTSYTQDMQRRGLSSYSTVLALETVAPDLETRTRLDLRPGEMAVYLERLRYAENEPMCHEVALFPGRLETVLHEADLTGSVHAVLSDANVRPRSIERNVRAVVASARECQLLELPPSSPALEIIDVFTDTLGRKMQYARSRYRFDRYEVLSIISA